MRKKKYFVGGNLDLMQSAQTKAVSGTKVNDALAIPTNQPIPTEQIAGQAAGGISGNMGIFGGIANQGIQEIGSAIGLPGQSSQMVGGTAQAAMGALTGNPADIAGGVGDILGAGIANAKTTFQNKNADFGDKAMATLGVINPVAGVISSFKNKDYARQQETKDMMNNVIKNNMMANGGLLPKEAYAVSNASYNGISRPPVNYQPMTGITVDSIPQQQPNGNLASVPQLSPDEIRRLNLVRSYNLGQAYDAELQDYYLDANPQMQHDIGRSIVNRPAANPGQVERGIQSDLDVIRQAEGRKRKPARLFAEGGMLNRFDGGFTHNNPSVQNSFEGIPIARGDNGEMHVVENGEASLPTSDGNQYIFSDKNKLTKNLAKQLNIANKYVGKTFAQIAKSYEDNTRKGDPLDEKTFDLNIRNLMAANEQAKQISEIGKVYKMAKGGKLNFNKYIVGGPLEKAPTAQVVQPRSEMLATQDPALVDAMRSAGFYGAPGNIQHDPTFSEAGKLDYLDGVDPENSDYGLFRGLTSQQYDATYLPWVNKTYGTSDNVQNQEALLSNFDPNSELWQSYNPEEQSRRYRLLGELQAKGYDTSNPEEVMKLVTDEKIGPATSLMNYSPYEQMTVEDILIDLPEPEVSYTPEGTPVDAKRPEKPTKNPPNLPNLWPELGLAGNLGAMAMLDPTYMTPSTMSTGYLRPQTIDEQTMRGNIDAANRANVGALANVTGGSGAAQRAGLLGQGVNYMGATGNAFTQANQANNAARMQADQFNIGTQGNVASQNMAAINQANAMNTGIANQYDMQKADTFASAVGDYSVAGADRRMSNDASKFWGRATGYDPKTAQYLLAMQNGNKPVEETKAAAYGGIIKTRKRKLK